MKVALDLHDFNIVTPRLEPLLKLKEYFPKFKVSLFTIPSPRRCDYGPFLVREETCEEIKNHLDWMQIIPHGLTHESSHEMEHYDYKSFMQEVVPKIMDEFRANDLPFVRGFCAPHWRWSEGVVKALDEMGWWGAVLREDKMLVTKRFYRYNFLLNEPFWESKEEVLKLHGHTYGTKNDVVRCMNNLLKLPKDTEFVYITDFIETK